MWRDYSTHKVEQLWWAFNDQRFFHFWFISLKMLWAIKLTFCQVWRVPLVEQERHTLPEHLSSYPVFSGSRVDRSQVFYVMFCRSLFVLLSFFFWPLCCLSFFDLRILWYLQTLLHSLWSSGSGFYETDKMWTDYRRQTTDDRF